MMTRKLGRLDETCVAVIALSNRLNKDAQSDEDTDLTVMGLLCGAISVWLQETSRADAHIASTVRRSTRRRGAWRNSSGWSSGGRSWPSVRRCDRREGQPA